VIENKWEYLGSLLLVLLLTQRREMSSLQNIAASSIVVLLILQGRMEARSIEVTPEGIMPEDSWTSTVDQIGFPGAIVSAGRHYQNTFAVTPKHVKLTKPSGVRFNVETVPEPLPEHLNKPKIDRVEELRKIRRDTVDAHNSKYSKSPCDESFWIEANINQANQASENDVWIEATSKHEPNLIYRGANGFIVAVVLAFAQHLPLELSPDHIWALITYAFAKHVDEHAEELRHLFVSHKGKQRILIDTDPSFTISRDQNPDTGATAEEWEQQVFSQFSSEIRKYVGNDTHAALTANFSTTTPSSRAASEIVLMAAMKNYFSYGMRTMCGIPEITLLGTEDDWIALRSRTEALGKRMLPSFADYWMPALLPVLDEFHLSYKGKVNHGFWQSMVKLRATHGSGAATFISGWIQTFFPHIKNIEGGDRNQQATMRQWNEMYFSGPEPSDFPMVESFAPCDWVYYGTNYDLEFHAGIAGVCQDPETGTISPVTGWYVIHTLSKPKEVQIEEIEKEIHDRQSR
jgi:Domain of unknown function (DUF4419)